jgi:cardiolipin synthase
LRRASSGNSVTIYHNGKESFESLIDAVSKAKQHVHLEYYIFQADDTGDQLGNLLINKAKQGIECRLLVDFIGCWGRKRWAFLSKLHNGGVEIGYFLPVVPWKGRVRTNFRNHRKIAIIDGEIGFTGSQNIGNEYVGLSKEFSIWHDTHLKITGPAVADLQEIFIDDWLYATRRYLRKNQYYPKLTEQGNQLVHILPSGPDTNTKILHHLLFAVISAARRSVHIATPYFVPDSTMLLALEAAAYRGVEVVILMPAELDMPLTLWAGRSYYRDLLLSGVDIYEYQAGMMHSKVVIVDNLWGMVGSANMDVRSFRLNFETSVYLYNQELARQLEDNFQSMLQESKPVDLRDTYHSFGVSLRQGFARLISPML